MSLWNLTLRSPPRDPPSRRPNRHEHAWPSFPSLQATRVPDHQGRSDLATPRVRLASWIRGHALFFCLRRDRPSITRSNSQLIDSTHVSPCPVDPRVSYLSTHPPPSSPNTVQWVLHQHRQLRSTGRCLGVANQLEYPCTYHHVLSLPTLLPRRDSHLVGLDA